MREGVKTGDKTFITTSN